MSKHQTLKEDNINLEKWHNSRTNLQNNENNYSLVILITITKIKVNEGHEQKRLQELIYSLLETLLGVGLAIRVLVSLTKQAVHSNATQIKKHIYKLGQIIGCQSQAKKQARHSNPILRSVFILQ